jgi:SAM-dependent methyltransferase
MCKATLKTIGEFWDKKPRSSLAKKSLIFARELLKARRLPVRGWLTSVVRSSGDRIGWWSNPFVVRKINELVCGLPVDGRDQGLVFRLRERYGDILPLPRAVSVGCGDGDKELALLKQGIAGHFDLYELSENRIAKGKRNAQRAGLSDRVSFREENPFEADAADCYDLVVWCDALHHMPDVDKALAWSRRVLREGGILFLSDFVGPTRFQWTDRSLGMAGAVRKALDPKFLVRRNEPFAYPPAEIRRPTVEDMIARDISEAWDSGNILASIAKHFPEATMYPAGGVVYFLALNSSIHNFHPERDRDILELLLLYDKMCIEAGESVYAAALGRKT